MGSRRKKRIAQWAALVGTVLATVAWANTAPTTRPAKSSLRKPMSILPSRGKPPVASPAPSPAPPALFTAPHAPAPVPTSSTGSSANASTPPPPAVISLPAQPAPIKKSPLGLDESLEDEKEIKARQALDRPCSLKVQNQPITEAIRLLSESAGVPIEFDRFVLSCLPYGTRTQITATIQHQPLRDSLTALLRPLACKYGMDRDKIVIQARPALFRICRRATWEEVALIEKLYSVPWNRQLADTLEFQFMDMPSDAAEANRQKIIATAESIGSGSFARVLDIACDQFGWVWHPEGGTVAICTRVRQVERSMGRLVTVRYSEIQLKDVLLDLCQRAGILLKMEPGVLTALPAHQSERFRLTLENVSIRQAFELVAGETGLGFVIEPDGIRITPSTSGPLAGSRPGEGDTAALTLTKSANPVVGQVPIPGLDGAVWFIREQDLPPDVNRMRLQQLKLAGERIRSVDNASE